MKKLTHDEFVNLIRDALGHLYDPTYLQKHPLADLLIISTDFDLVTRAQKLRQILLEALERLQPPDSAFSLPENADSYHALHYRYLDGLSSDQIADLLVMSPRQAYRKIRDGIEAIASLLEDQLHLQLTRESHIETGESDLTDRRNLARAAADHLGSYAQAEVIELGAILENIVKELQPYCARIGSQIELDIAQSPLFVYADRTMLRQGMINLLSSALSTNTGSVLAIKARSMESQLWMTLDMQTQDDLDELGHPNKARQGIGLDVAIRLFDMQGIQVANHPSSERWHVEITMAQAGPHHVLVIDDMPDVPQLFQRYVKSHAIEIIGAGNAEQAFNALQHITPRLILLDVMLPRRDGWEILQTLKSDPSTAHIPVIICSILNEPELALSLGADDYLGKPVSQAAFLKTMFRWLHPDQKPAGAPR